MSAEQYRDIHNGVPGPWAPIPGHTLGLATPDTYELDTSDTGVTDTAHGGLNFDPGSDRNFIDLRQGGDVVLNGTGNTVTGTGDIYIHEGASQGGNTFQMGGPGGSGTLSIDDIKPTDRIVLIHASPADLDAAWAHMQEGRGNRGFSIMAGGVPVALNFHSASEQNFPTKSQFWFFSPGHPPPGFPNPYPYTPPRPALLAWKGGDGNADDPLQWTPYGVPSPGATAFMANGVVNLGADDPMSGSPLYMPLGNTIQTLNVGADDHLQFGVSSSDETTVNLADNSHWIGGLGVSPLAHATIAAAGSGEWDNGFSFNQGAAVVNAPVSGYGGMIVGTTGSVEFQQSVGAGQVVGISGSETHGGAHSVVTVDDPADYHATTIMGQGELVLKGVQADSWSLRNDMLTLYKGGSAVDQIRFGIGSVQGFGPHMFGVSQTGSDVTVHTDGIWYHNYGALPQV